MSRDRAIESIRFNSERFREQAFQRFNDLTVYRFAAEVAGGSQSDK